ncbi:MSMEG_1061 family FMN-dependent PPOX-type flavoprotein [Nocardia farcinica]|uniref:MSMEG_1061 family FMN-dependent PPOX-type flavoprotein n=1 Tax=Nocardia farcinica TaxID=37329 RepID=UPI0018934C32|nr:MSMEG_1061 family FMN-dependent PPOX-type flavoprotein [Nocardia farcinica]MBF6271645.1 pyridoxamine 5'-phosphate oxidase family protein [Nocardia farcinica]MCZ9330369.1 pyridoxamine 5'-phosphate oxidase family protein [Nocardia farcinica]
MSNRITARPVPLPMDRVREIIGAPEALAAAKVQTRIDTHFRRFIAHSPFLCLATTHPDKGADCSPRGDYPGFVKVLDDATLAIPDRVGNGRIDSFENLASNPSIGLIFLVPGHRETLRVNGKAYLTEDPDVLARLQVEGKTPRLAVIVDVEEAFVHCGRAVIRSRLWDSSSQSLATEVPSMGDIVADQMRPKGLDANLINSVVETGYKTLY